MSTMQASPVSGLTLKLERVARDVKSSDLAAQAGMSRSWVSRVESRRIVNAADVERYRAALTTFPTVAAPQTAQDAA